MRYVAHRKARCTYALTPNTETQSHMHARAFTHVLLKLRIHQCYTTFYLQQWQFHTVQIFLIVEKGREVNSFFLFSTNKLPNFLSPIKKKMVTLPCHLTLFLGCFSSSLLLMTCQCPVHPEFKCPRFKEHKMGLLSINRPLLLFPGLHLQRPGPVPLRGDQRGEGKNRTSRCLFTSEVS